MVVINGRFLSSPTSGVSRVGSELLRALIAEYPRIAADVQLRLAVPPHPAASHADVLHAAPLELQSRGLPGRIGEQLLPALYPRALILNFCNVTPIFAPRSVLWLHDAQVFDSPETYTTAYRAWHHTIFHAARARKLPVVTVSSFSRDRLIHHGLDPAQIRVVHNGGDHILRAPADSSVLERAGLTRAPFVLVLGSPARHKNVPFAVQALVRHADPALQIAVVGMSQEGPYTADEHLANDPRVVVLPRLSDAQLRALYRAAEVVLVPSLFEGFGLYAAEAMHADSGPLVLSKRASLPEVGGDAALYFEPTDPHALVAAVELARKPEQAAQLRAAAKRRREQFRWQKAAQRVIADYLTLH
jgi:glycosyltransferase involved in cell wall biosynthesis